MTGRARIASGTLAYSLRGTAEGPPILLLRPLGGSMALWGDFADRLAVERKVLAFDPRGVGQSSDAPWSLTTRAMARDAAQLLDALGVRTADVFGLSLGGQVGAWLAIDAPARVRRLILASLPRPSAIARRLPRLVPRLIRDRADAEAQLVEAILSSSFRRTEPRRVAEIKAIARAHARGQASILKLGLAALRSDPAPHLGEIQAPTLLLVGALDRMISEAELLTAVPDARLERIASAGHDLSLERPIELAQHVLAFLNAGGNEPG